ncbi:MAG: sugar phosphate nucleotidyltransferase [Verrucomicrobiota bacterium]|nr:sugar phosphate nucleotidyltransferase [Verrucomicrobiota bacterium]MDD8050704.1 sugar phosphate nucleotidyltransferase [Verrucomicrobiota bacterium]
MKALILAAGKGTRMKDLTKAMPKPMLPVRGKPTLLHILEGLASAQIRDFVIITGFQAEVVEEYFGDGSRFGWNIQYVRQTVQDGTGKAPELAKAALSDGPFVLSYGDILVDPANYKALRQTFEEEACAAVVSIWRGEDTSKGGAVMIDDKGDMLDIIEKPPPGTVTSPWYNAGLYAFDPVLFDYTARLEKSPRGEYELTDALKALCQTGKRVRTLLLKGHWIDVRDPEELERAQGLLAPDA